jgi:formamidopyrimidine-DNA glycosylase
MPELPEVQTVVTTLKPKVIGKTIRRINHVRQDILCPLDLDLPAKLAGRKIVGLDRRGKRIVFTLDDGNYFYIHLGMTGRLTTAKRHEKAPLHTHLELDLGGMLLRFKDPRRFGGLWWLGSSCDHEDMGPEPLQLRPAQLAAQLSRTTRAIKNALLDQRVVAGLGNIYVDESLFAAQIHPLTPANKLPLAQITRLNRAIKATLRKALRHRGSSLRDYVDANGAPGAFQKLHNVYDRENEPCRIRASPIKRIVLGGRSTHFCPRCQRRSQGRRAARASRKK